MSFGTVLLGVHDVTHCCVWALGSLVRTFDMGREGYLPDLRSDTGKRIVQEARSIREEIIKKQSKPSNPVGFY